MKPIDSRLLRYSRSSRGFILIVALIALVNACLTIAQAWFLSGAVVDIFQNHIEIALLSRTVIGLIIIFVARSIINFFGDWTGSMASTKIRNELRIKLLNSVVRNGSEFANKSGNAKLAILATKGINDLDGYFAKFLPQLLIAALVPGMVGLVITFEDWRSGLICLFTVPLIPLFGILIGRYTSYATKEKLATLTVMSGYFLDLLNGLNTLKVFGREKLQSEKIQEVGEGYRKDTLKVLKISFLSSLALELVATISVALIAVSIGLRLVGGSISLKTSLLVLILAPEVYWPIRQVAGYFHAASDGIAVFEHVFEILEAKFDDRLININSFKSIEWDELTISYPNRSSVIIPAGKFSRACVHLITGPSGTGKTTLSKVLLGLLIPTSGTVRIICDEGSFELDEVNRKSWWEQISWMPQDPKFPVSTVREILKQSKPDATDAELVTALSSVSLKVFDLPNGLLTMVGTSKAGLSIGQLRKIALARAILKPAPLLILDEPSASVDDASESEIKDLIAKQALNGRAVVLISHRQQLQDQVGSRTVIGETE